LLRYSCCLEVVVKLARLGILLLVCLLLGALVGCGVRGSRGGGGGGSSSDDDDSAAGDDDDSALSDEDGGPGGDNVGGDDAGGGNGDNGDGGGGDPGGDDAGGDDPGGDDDDELLDADGDGLADVWELAHGLSTSSPDTDNDSWGDYEEVFGFADPLDSSDHPYIGGWPRGPVPDNLQGGGTSVGSVAPNWSLQDQFGEAVNLWSFYGQVIMVESVAEW